METLVNSLDAYLQTGSLLAYTAAFAGGVLISFTPCVYPVLPITVGYIGGASQGSRARGFLLSLVHVMGMALTYAVLGTAAALSGQVFGRAAASPAANLVVGGACILMALVMLDVVPMPLPSFLSGRAPGKGRPGLFGAFSVGLASGLVVGPCTAPVLGTLVVYVAAGQNVLYGSSLLFAFALGMGALLLVAGTFTGILASFPKSGKWLVYVKKGFGVFLILAGGAFLLRAANLLL